MSVFVVVPVFNEEQHIVGVIEGLKAYNYEIVVVNDASLDRTLELLDRYRSSSNIHIVHHQVNRGQGAALETGNQYARRRGATIIIYFDGDNQFNPADIEPALSRLTEAGLDVILGSRFLDRRSTIPWVKRFIIFPVSRLINFVLTGLSLTDVHNGFRIFTAQTLEKVTISQDRMAHGSEILSLIKKYNLSFEEFPVEVRYHRYGQGVLGGLKILQDWLMARFM